jgi:hypothetical protein
MTKVSDAQPRQSQFGTEVQAAIGRQLREIYGSDAQVAAHQELPPKLRELLSRLAERRSS